MLDDANGTQEPCQKLLNRTGCHFPLQYSLNAKWPTAVKVLAAENVDQSDWCKDIEYGRALFLAAKV